MSKPSRPLRSSPTAFTGARTFFVTSVTWGRRSLFQSEHLARLFCDVLVSYRNRQRYLLHEFVLMPNHFHALISVPPGSSVEKAVQLMKGGFSFRARKELDIPSEIWERGFSDEYVADRKAFRALREYIRQNPVRAGFVRAAEEYPYSSARADVATDPIPEHLRG